MTERAQHLGRRGYNLVEMALALAVLGLLLGGALVPLQAQYQREQVSSTRDYLQQAKAAIMAYAVSHSTIGREIVYFNGVTYTIPSGRPYLPCPDINDDGEEDRVSAVPGLISASDLHTIGTCNEQKGLVPWKTLGIAGTDVWGNRLTYAVDQSFSSEILGTDPTFYADIFDRRLAPSGASGDTRLALRASRNQAGIIICSSYINDTGGGCPNDDLSNIVAGVVTDTQLTLGAGARRVPEYNNASANPTGIISGAVFVVLSHGRNGKGAIGSGGKCKDFAGTGSHDDLIEEANAFYHSGHRLRGPSFCAEPPSTPRADFYENVFVQTPISNLRDDTLDAPDDLLLWVGSEELFGFLVAANALPAEALEFLP